MASRAQQLKLLYMVVTLCLLPLVMHMARVAYVNATVSAASVIGIDDNSANCRRR